MELVRLGASFVVCMLAFVASRVSLPSACLPGAAWPLHRNQPAPARKPYAQIVGAVFWPCVGSGWATTVCGVRCCQREQHVFSGQSGRFAGVCCAAGALRWIWLLAQLLLGVAWPRARSHSRLFPQVLQRQSGSGAEREAEKLRRSGPSGLLVRFVPPLLA